MLLKESLMQGSTNTLRQYTKQLKENLKNNSFKPVT